MYRYTLLVALFLFCSASLCQAQITKGVYVGNQGNFSDNNGSITFYDPATEQSTQVLSDFGTLVQSIYLDQGKGYIMSNTSDAVDVLDLATQQRSNRYDGVAAPRYMAVSDGTRGYVSNLWTMSVTVLDLSATDPTAAILGTIDVGSNPEDIAISGNRVYVANSGFGADSTLSVIEIATGDVIDTIDLGCRGPRHLEVDKENEVWAFCVGQTIYDEDFNVIDRIPGGVVVLDGSAGTILESFDLPFQVGAFSLGQDTYYAVSTQEIFLLHDGELLVFSTARNEQMESITLAMESDDAISSIAYDPDTRSFYAGRTTDFTSQGYVSIHDLAGNETGRFQAGIAPAHIALLQDDESVATENLALPETFGLQANYPNPFSRSTRLPYQLSSPGHVTLTIYDALGRVVATPVQGWEQAGTHEAFWNANALPSGVYFARLIHDGHVSSQRLLLAR